MSLSLSPHLNFICVIAGTYGAEARIKLTGASAGATSLSSDVVRGKCSIHARKNRAALELRERRVRATEGADFSPKWSDFSSGSGKQNVSGTNELLRPEIY